MDRAVAVPGAKSGRVDIWPTARVQSQKTVAAETAPVRYDETKSECWRHAEVLMTVGSRSAVQCTKSVYTKSNQQQLGGTYS